MSLNQEVDLLRKIPMFANIEPSKLKLLAFTSDRITFASGQELFHQGDPGETAYIIIEGDADILVDSTSGELTVASVGQNDIVGEMAVLINVPRTATVRATSDLTTLAISKDQFFRMIAEFPEMAVEIMRELALRLERTTNQLRAAMTGS